MSGSGGAGELPHGANGIRMGTATFTFANDKIIVTTDGSPWHWTLHLGPKSGELDVHLTRRTEGGETEYTRLFSVKHPQLKAMLRELGEFMIPELRRLIRPLRLGWMARQRLEPVIGLTPGEADLAKVTVIRRRKLVVDPEKLANNARIPEDLEELYDLPEGESFALVMLRRAARPRRIGTGFKSGALAGLRTLVWVKDDQVARVTKRLEVTLHQLAEKYGVFHEPLPWEWPGNPGKMDAETCGRSGR